MFRTHFIYIFIYLSIPLKLQSSPPCPPSERLWLQFSGFPASNIVQYIWLVLFEWMCQPLNVILYRWFASHSITGLHRLLPTLPTVAYRRRLRVDFSVVYGLFLFTLSGHKRHWHKQRKLLLLCFARAPPATFTFVFGREWRKEQVVHGVEVENMD